LAATSAREGRRVDVEENGKKRRKKKEEKNTSYLITFSRLLLNPTASSLSH